MLKFMSVRGEGSASVDAIFQAIDKVFNHQLKLISYSVDAVTDGIDAQATTVVSVEIGRAHV